MFNNYNFVIPLKKNKYSNATNWISQLLLLLSIIFLTLQLNYNTTNTSSAINNNFIIVYLVAIIIGWLYLKWKQLKQHSFYYRSVILIAALSWFLIPNLHWLFIVYFIAAIIEKPVRSNTVLAFNKKEIVLNDFPTKKFQWNQFNNIVLKDGLLTLDFSNNKLYQKEIENKINNIYEIEFNHFCAIQINNTIQS